MRRRLRTLAVILQFSFRASPGRTVTLFVTQVLGQIALLASLLSIKLTTDAVVNRSVHDVIGWSAFMAGASAATIIVGRLYLDLAKSIEERATLLIDRQLMELTTRIPGIEHHERPDFMDQIDLLRAQRLMLAQATTALVLNLRLALQLLGTALLLAQITPALLPITLLGFGAIAFQRKSHQIDQRANEANAERSRLRKQLFELTTSAAAGKELRVFGLNEEVLSRHGELVREIRRVRVRAELRGLLLELAGAGLAAAGFVAALTLVLARAIDGDATVGDLLLTVTLATQMNVAISAAAGNTAYLFQALTAADRVVWLADYAAAQPELDRPKPVPDPFADGISFDHVSFRYDGAERPVLSDLNVRLPAGSVVAIVGENGAGKTTIVKLLCQFYEPSSGRILVDGTDLREIDANRWRPRVAAGFQDFVRYELLARETVGVGDLPRMSSAGVVESAIERAGATALIEDLPLGLDHQLGKSWEGGIELSGGEWQKLALGRSLMREEPLLTIFDEPTAALDAYTEHALFERIAAAAREREDSGGIVVLVSHRFSTVRMADRIIVLDEGRITESGSHAELMALGATYAQLYRLQERAYRDGLAERS
jgi:ABC-type multidrug transport system fused ATPase/permease subunit